MQWLCSIIIKIKMFENTLLKIINLSFIWFSDCLVNEHWLKDKIKITNVLGAPLARRQYTLIPVYCFLADGALGTFILR